MGEVDLDVRKCLVTLERLVGELMAQDASDETGTSKVMGSRRQFID